MRKAKMLMMVWLCSICMTMQSRMLSDGNDDSGYVMVYHKDSDHGFYMAYSYDGYKWTSVNGDSPVMAGDTIAEQKGIRDPYIFRGSDGGFCVAMTDLHVFGQRDGIRATQWERPAQYGWGNNRGLVLLKSFDLIHWTRVNLDFTRLTCPTGEVDLDGTPIPWSEVGCVWAPEMTIDDTNGKIMMHFTTRFRNGRNVIYYVYMNDDFTEMISDPKFLFGSVKDEKGNFRFNMIDSDIIKVDGTYHLFASQHGFGKHATSNCITGPYTLDTLYSDNEPLRHEAPCIWKRGGEKRWVLMYDNYSKSPTNFGFAETTDFKTFTSIGHFDEPGCKMTRTNFSEQKHGAVVAATRKEIEKLVEYWKKKPVPYGRIEDNVRVLMPGDYPDPSIMRDGNDYYMTHSSFLYYPGFLIWHSTDLKHWKPIKRVLPELNASVMAPDLCKVNGKFYLYFPTSKGENYVMSADDVRGEWSLPKKIDVRGIDPGHILTDNGKRYLFTNNGHVVQLSSDGLSAVSTNDVVYKGWEYPKEWKTEGMYLESPKLCKRGDYYYMVSAQGGTAGPATSHMAVVARARDIVGPWENSPYNPLVHTYSATEDWWSKGHGTLIDTPDGYWYFVYHGYLKDFHTLGRSTLMNKVEWTQDGWPVVVPTDNDVKADYCNPDGTCPPMKAKTYKDRNLMWVKWSDKFNGSDLWMTTAIDKSYRITAEMKIGKGGEAGLYLFYNDKANIGLVSTDKHVYFRITNRNNFVTTEISLDGKTWVTKDKDADISSYNHNVFKGFLALRPAISMKGNVNVKSFEYKTMDE